MTGTFFEEQARALMKRGIKTGVFFPDIDMQFNSRLKNKRVRQPKDFLDHGLPTFYHFVVSIIPRSRLLNYWYLCYSASVKFKKYIRLHGKPDILHAHCIFNAGIVARYLSWKFSIPYVVTEHYTGLIIEQGFSVGVRRKLIRNVYEDSRHNIIVSTAFAADMERVYRLAKNVFEVIPNMVDSSFFVPPRVRSGQPDKVLFTNSFLMRKKNHFLLLRAFELVLKQRPNVTLVIGGDGPLSTELHEFSRRLGIENNVTFLGELGRHEVKKQLDACDMFVSSSKYETFGVAIIEALASGKPVVATDSGGPRDIITSGDGILVKDHKPEEFAAAIVYVIDHPQSYDDEDIRKRCYDRFREEEVINRLLTIYHNTGQGINSELGGNH